MTRPKTSRPRKIRRKRPLRLPRNAKELSSRSANFQQAYAKTVAVLSRMRQRVSLTRAAHEHGIDPRTVMRLGSSVLRKQATGRYSVKPNDQLLRILVMSGQDGLHEVAVRGSKQATLLAQHANAVRLYVRTGDARPLGRFRGKTIKDTSGNKIPLLTDLDSINKQATAGILSFENLYARSA